MDAARILNGLRIAFSAGLILAAGHPVSALLIRVPQDHPNIQAAIDAADHGDTVLIAPGTWTGPGNRDLDPSGKAIVIRSAGGAESCIIDCRGLGRGFHFHNCESSITVVKDLTIRGGFAESGGGISGYWSSPTIMDCVITDCTASGAGGGIGGHYFSPLVLDCRIAGNRAMDGGGIHLERSPETRLYRCTISDNIAERTGGGLCCRGGSTPLLFDCTLSGNTGLLGGGAGFEDAGPTLQGCRFEMNRAWDGGGLYCCGPAGLSLLDTVFTLNKAAYGGAIYGCHGTLDVTNCLLVENSTTATGGALYGRQLIASITGCTISGNTALESRGGGISTRGSRLVMTDCILWDNRPDEILTVDGEEPLVTFCDVAGGHPGAGNLDADPLFTCAPCGTHCLCQLAAGEKTQSPCIDAGSRPARLPSSPDGGAPPRSAGTITRSDWGVDRGRLDLGFHHRLNTIHARLDCLPSFGWLPFPASFTVIVGNSTPVTRRIAAHAEFTTPDGTSYPDWRSGWIDVNPDKVAAWHWNLTIPACQALAGFSTFSLAAEDVTPPPWNLPPCPPAGHRYRHSSTVFAALPTE